MNVSIDNIIDMWKVAARNEPHIEQRHMHVPFIFMREVIDQLDDLTLPYQVYIPFPGNPFNNEILIVVKTIDLINFTQPRSKPHLKLVRSEDNDTN